MSQTVVVVGGAAVGKSAVSLRFIRDEFVSVYEPTVEDAYRKHVETNGEQGVVEVIDTAGTDQFKAMRDLYYKNSDAFVLVCSVDQNGSFREVTEIRQQIIDIKDTTDLPLVVVVNKHDLAKERWNLDVDEVQRITKAWKVKLFFTSAKSGENVNEVFHAVISQARSQKKSSSPKKKSPCNLL